MVLGRHMRLGLGLLVALTLAGCGSGASGPGATAGGGRPTGSLTIATKGLGYRLEITTKAGQQCTTATYQTRTQDGRTLIQTLHSCGSPSGPGHPVLLQARSSPRAMLLDVPRGGCATVRAGLTPTSLRPVPTRCSAPTPDFRVAVLPAASRLVVSGVPGATVIRFPRSCPVGICIRSVGPP
jgi:hypothetical protein